MVTDQQTIKDEESVSRAKHTAERLRELNVILAHGAIGDYSKDVPMPEEEDEFTPLYIGVQAMIEVIREKIAELEDSREKAEIGAIHRTEELFKTQFELDKQTKTLEAVFANLEEAVVVMDKDGKFLLFNPSAEKIGGAMKQAAISEWSKTYGIFYPDGITPFPSERLPNVLALQGENVSNVELVIKNEQVPEGICVIASSSPIRNVVGDIAGAILIFRDVTEQKKMGKKVEQYAKELKEYIDHMSNFNAKIAPDGTLILVSSVAEKVSGMSHEDLMRTNFLEGQWWGFDPEVQARVLAAFQRAVAGETVSYEEKLLAFGKEIMWINFSLMPVLDDEGKTSFVIAEGLNITDRKHMEEKIASYTKNLENEVFRRTLTLKLQLEREKRDKAIIEEESEHSKILLESIGDGIVVTDPNGKVLTINGSAEAMFGLDKKDIIGKIFWEMVPFEDEHGKLVALDDRPIFHSIHALEKATGTYTFLQRGDGKLSAITTSTPVIYKGNVAGVIIVFHDVTKEKEIERSKTEFVSIASHQLRTPLTSIRLFTEMLLSDKIEKLSSSQRERLESVHEATKAMVVLVNELLSLARIEAGRIEIEPTMERIESFCEEIIAEVLPIANERKCEIVFKKPPTPFLPVFLDKNIFRQVLHNFLTNAIRYTEEGKGHIIVEIQEKDGRYVLSVTDNGIGIPKELQPKVFEKFFRAENAKKIAVDGTGIGLYSAKIMLKESGGQVGFTSDGEGKGAVFFVSLPKGGMQRKKSDSYLAL